MARTYKRDALGRFAGGGGGGGRPKARSVSKGANRLTRDNAGRITSVGGTGATARGGRLRTAGGNLRAAQTARIKGSGGRLRKPAGAKVVAAKAPSNKVERVIARLNRVGEGRTGLKGKSALNVRRNAAAFLNSSYISGTQRYERGAKKGQPRDMTERLKRASEMIASGSKAARNARRAYKEGMKPRAASVRLRPAGFDTATITKRQDRVFRSNQLKRGGLSSNKSERASKVYGSQLSGRQPRGRGAGVPEDIRRAATAEKRANRLRLAKVGAAKGGEKLITRLNARSGVVKSDRSAGASLRTARRKALSVKLDAMQRSEAKYAKRKYGVHSTITNPGRRSQRSPRRTLQSGQRVAITGRTTGQIQRSYARDVTNKLFDNYNRGLTRNLGPKVRITKQPLYNQYSVFGGSQTVSRTRVTRR